jgi:DNA-binding response OmpR family regulator
MSGEGRAGASDAACYAPAPSRLVLLVEDQPDLRGLLSDYLLSRGLVPVPAGGSAHAEVVCQALAPDVVLIDLPLLDGDGAALIRHIKARRPDVAIVVCTRPDPEREAHYRSEGADEIVGRPLDLMALDRTLGRLASWQRPA